MHLGAPVASEAPELDRVAAGAAWLLDIDGSIVDSQTGASLRPMVEALLVAMRRTGRPVAVWSAGGADHAAAMVARHGLGSLVDAAYDKRPGPLGTWAFTHLAPNHLPAICIDDQPHQFDGEAIVVAIPPYLSADPHDRGLAPVLEVVTALR